MLIKKSIQTATPIAAVALIIKSLFRLTTTGKSK